MSGVQVLEWWPDHGDVLLHLRTGRGGQPVDLGSLGLSDEFRRRLRNWSDQYWEETLPGEDGNAASWWVAEGVQLLGEVRRELAGRYTVVVTEPWWGEEPTED